MLCGYVRRRIDDKHPVFCGLAWPGLAVRLAGWLALCLIHRSGVSLVRDDRAHGRVCMMRLNNEDGLPGKLSFRPTNAVSGWTMGWRACGTRK